MKRYQNYKYLAALYGLILYIVPTDAQTSDFGVWTSLAAEKNFGKFEVTAETELRTNNQCKQICRWSMGAEMSYRPVKPFTLGTGYQFMRFFDDRFNDFQPRHRVYLYLQGKYRAGDFTFTLRENLQRTTKDESDRIKQNGEINTYRINPDVVWRNRLKVIYDIPKFPVNPAFSVESFYQLNNPDGNAFEQLRYIFSLKYSPFKHHAFEAYGLFDKEMNVNNPEQMFVAGIQYKFSF